MRAYVTYSEARSAYKILVGILEGKRACGRPSRKWEDNTKWNLSEISWEGVEWINMDRDMDK
jgi:hypothetical protein